MATTTPMKALSGVDDSIFFIRGERVMVDADLARLYGVTTKRLNEQVKRNRLRFPADFMFQLNRSEKAELVANCDRLKNLKHSSINPMAFTEQGVAMLSSVLRSPKAVKINIEIMRAFVYYRQILLQNQDLYKKVKELDDKINHVYRSLLNKIEISKNSIEPVGYKLKSKKEQK